MIKQRAAAKTGRNPIKISRTENPLALPDWMRVQLPRANAINQIKKQLRQHHLHSVCEESACPNLGECFSYGTATFMIMGDRCTRRCAFCDVAHGRPAALDENEPQNIAETIKSMALRYVVVTSVDRDDLRDGGAAHFAACIKAIRALNLGIKIETLTPDYRGRLDKALAITVATPPDVFNHNIETVPELYKIARPGADYQHSLNLLKQIKLAMPSLPTKSGLMLGLGETDASVKQTLHDLRDHKVDCLTLGQYLQPSLYHMPVKRFVHPDIFTKLGKYAKNIGFSQVASGPLVRSSYHADKQYSEEAVN